MKRVKIEAVERPPLRQKLPEEIMAELLGMVRSQFCPDAPDKVWFRDIAPFVRTRVILWPAKFMVGKGYWVAAK